LLRAPIIQAAPAARIIIRIYKWIKCSAIVFVRRPRECARRDTKLIRSALSDQPTHLVFIPQPDLQICTNTLGVAALR
jgi:hypothetical protein